jgi:predicted nucleotidyltransferase
MSEQYAAYMPHIRQRWFDEQASWEQRRQQAWTAVRQITEMLRQSFAADQIIAFGSLIAEGPYDDRSDIDLAVAGLKPTLFFRAYAQSMSLASPFKLDLIDLADCPESIRESIIKHGVHL